MARNLVRHARHRLDFENSLRLSAKSNSRFERVLDTMVTKKLKKIGGILVHNDFAIGDMDSESIRQKLFLFLQIISNYSKLI